jgi:photosystem II stability/assembly factor-like uncharacterized protein
MNLFMGSRKALPLAAAVFLCASACVSERSTPAPAVSWIVQVSGTDASLRGVSVVHDRTAWASGSKGTVLRTVDGGATWAFCPVPGEEATDFRDIEAFGPDEAVIMGIGRPAKIFKTTDGGKTWTRTFADDSPGMFLDGLGFFDDKNGFAVGDPMDGSTLFPRRTAGPPGRRWLRGRGRPRSTGKRPSPPRGRAWPS